VPSFEREIEVERLASGLLFCRLANRQAPIATTVLAYRAGCRDEPAGGGGTAHFLEHMMFKGSARFAAGEIDRRTQALGGQNNAFTSHDTTAYYFTFAADRWGEGLAIESDRMAGLTLEAREVASERQVIGEEIAMYRDDPWDTLELEVLAALFGDHPYARPVLGTTEELARVGREELAAFHRRFYRPDNAVLVVAGDVGGEARERAQAAFPARAEPLLPRPELPGVVPPRGTVRVERRHGEVARLLFAFPAPAPDAAEHGRLRLLATALASGRASRLQRALVEDGELCLGVSASLLDNSRASAFTIGAELLPGVEPERVEAAIWEELARLAAGPLSEEEHERARRVHLADWIFQHERIHQQALTVALALAEFDLEAPERLLAAALEVGPEELARLAARWLDPRASAVVGVSRVES
jgi:zinc protease